MGLDCSAAALEQPLVKLIPADGILMDLELYVSMGDMEVKSIKPLQAQRIRLDIDLQVSDDLGRNPPRTELLPGELLLVQDQARDAVPAQLPGAGRAGRPAADDDDLCINHL
jgi:hypothetical protein